MSDKSVAELFAIVADPRQDDESETLWESITILQRLGTRDVLDRALRLVASLDPRARVRGADILGQLGFPGRTFPQECLLAVMALLREDPDRRVLHAAAIAAGHLRDERATGTLVALADHQNAEVRFAVAFALGGRSSPEAIAALTRLTCDADPEVRDWATFGLKRKGTANTPSVHDALRRRLGHVDPDFRPIAARERHIIDMLLAADFPGRAELGAQCADALVKVIDREGSFTIQPSAGAALAQVRQRVAIEAFYPDREGAEDVAAHEAAFLTPCVHVLLHVLEGRAHEIEIYKDDGSAIAIDPDRATFRFYGIGARKSDPETGRSRLT